MKVSNVSIIKGQTIAESIVAAINEMFNDRASTGFIECLSIEGVVGTCIQQENNGITPIYTTTSYFIATNLDYGFVRVEYCSE